MIKIHIREGETSKTIPIPYFAIKQFLIKANNSVQGNEKNEDTINNLVRKLRSFAKKHPDFVLVEIEDKEDSTTLVIKLS